MESVQALTNRFEQVFEPRQAAVLAESITEAYNDLVKTSDFNELKAIVKNLAEAQGRTEVRMGELAQAQGRTEVRMEELAQAQGRTEARMEELAHAQERTEARMEELAHAQERTEARMEELAHAQERTEVRMEELAQAQERTEARMGELAHVVVDMGRQMGGLSRSMAYALENEAYRSLPAYLREHHGITLSERIVRTDVAGEEINFFALGQRNDEPICLVGESKLQLDERRRNKREAESLINQIERKVEAVRQVFPDRAIVRLLVTHYARPAILKFLQENHIIVVQTFEW